MKTLIINFLAAFVLSLVTVIVPATAEECGMRNHPATDVYDGWHLAVQAWTFNRFSFYEALEKIDDAGIDWVEAFPGQKLSPEKPDIKIDHTMPLEARNEVKKKLAELGLRLINYGVVKMPEQEKECRKIFEFAQDMGIETILAEPQAEQFDMLDSLCNEYKIKLGIHNHPIPSIYWDPDKVLQVLQDHSAWIGAAADIGHWMRSGVNPLEAVKKLQGRIICLHFKDLNEFGNKDAHDVPWGTGVAGAKELLMELHRQKFRGVFSIEYEYNWENSLPEVKECARFFNNVAGQPKPPEWSDLLTADLSNCIFPQGSWTVENDIVTWHGGGYLWTRQQYGNFILDLEYKVSPDANSGIFLRTSDLQDFVQTGIEVQIHETTDGTPRGMCGAIYDCLAPSKDVAKNAGQWNHYTIKCMANKICVVLNGELIIDMDLDMWTEPHRNPDGSNNKFDTAYKDMPRTGHIGFQDHGQPVWFRNLRIKQL